LALTDLDDIRICDFIVETGHRSLEMLVSAFPGVSGVGREAIVLPVLRVIVVAVFEEFGADVRLDVI
jgi:hypothetical protein